ncbi:MAG: hypothetical protein U0V70_09200 [Terriglobia bacterium]
MADPGPIPHRRATLLALTSPSNFAKSVPEMTPEAVKQILSNAPDFSTKSAVKCFIESVPEEFQEAVKEKKAVAVE